MFSGVIRAISFFEHRGVPPARGTFDDDATTLGADSDRVTLAQIGGFEHARWDSKRQRIPHRAIDVAMVSPCSVI